jgi:hypothetical protein
MAQQQFSPEQIQSAVESGLITQEDADSLLQQMEGDMPWGAAAGATVGGLAGAGIGALVGGPMGKKLSGAMSNLAGSNAVSKGLKTAGEYGEGAFKGGTRSQLGGDIAGAATGLGAGGMAGSAAGGMMDSEPQGLSDEQQQLIQALMSPETSPEDKKQILAMLQQMEQGGGEGDPNEQEPDQDVDDGSGFPWSQAAGGAAGAAIGASLGAGAGHMATRGAAGMMGKPRLGGFNAAQMGGAGAGLGLGGAGGIGAMGMMMDPRKQQYADPLGQG